MFCAKRTFSRIAKIKTVKSLEFSFKLVIRNKYSRWFKFEGSLANFMRFEKTFI